MRFWVIALGLFVVRPAFAHEEVRVRGNNPARSASEVVRGEDIISAAPHRTASDALSVVPGVFVTQHSGEGKANQIFLRGFDAVHGQDLELNVGGIPINEVSNIHGQGYSDLHFVMPEVLHEVRAQPGTYDPRQGDFAVAGSIRLRLGMSEPGFMVKGTAGSFGARRLFLAYNPSTESHDTFAAAEIYETDGFGPNRAARRASALAQATYDFDKAQIRVFASTYTARYDAAGVVPAAQVDSGKLDRFAVLDAKQGGASVRSQVLVELHDAERWSVAPFVVFRSLQLRQNFTGENNQQLNDSVTVGATSFYKKNVKIFSARDAFELGIYGRHDVIEQSQRALNTVDDSILRTDVDANVRGTNVAGWIDASVHPVDPIAVRGGIRMDGLAYGAADNGGQGRASQASHFGKKLTVDYEPVRRLHVLAAYGEGFRSPLARGLVNGERAFLTEVTSYEVGARWGDRSFSGSAAAFHTDLTDDLVFDPATARNERVPGTQRNGLTADVTVRALKMLTLSSSATYTRATFDGTSDLLPYVPQLVLRTDASLKVPLTRIYDRELVGRIGTGLEGLVRRPLPYGEIGRNVFLVDLSAGVRWKEIDLGVDIFNLLDAPWYDGQFVYASGFAGSRIPVLHVTAGPPRTTLFSLTLHFS